jgi:membrane associated rhomboid family serine protease
MAAYGRAIRLRGKHVDVRVRVRPGAALASKASGQRGHSMSARAGHSPELGSSARAASDAAAEVCDTFCLYLAKQFIAKRGFTVGTVPEADELAEHCDIVLSRHDGFALTIACMIDRETHPGRTFDLSPNTVEEIGKACLKYTGKVNFNKMPVIIQIFEVGPASAEQRERLKPFKRASLFAKVVPSAWIVDTASATVWSNARFGGLLSLKGVIEKLLRSPRESDAALQPRVVAVADPGFPWLTCAILAVLIGVFAAELVYGIGDWTKALQPTIATLVAFGGLSRLVVQAGEWYRLFSAPLLHGDIFHLALNCVALYLAGSILEGFVGRAWFTTIFVVGAVGGSLLSLALNPDSLVSVGASGAVMGLFAAMLAASFRFPSGAERTGLQMAAIYVLLPSLLPLASVFKGQRVDYAAHFGGAIAGAALGFVLLKIWPHDEPRPRWRSVAIVAALAGLLAFAYPVLPAIRGYPVAVLGAALIPQADLPQTDAAAKAQSADLVARYPRDPRGHLIRARVLLVTHDVAGAERELRAGLAEEDVWRTLFKPDLAIALRTTLALVLAEDRMDEARAVARPVCEAVQSGPSREALDKMKLCAT